MSQTFVYMYMFSTVDGKNAPMKKGGFNPGGVLSWGGGGFFPTTVQYS